MKVNKIKNAIEKNKFYVDVDFSNQFEYNVDKLKTELIEDYISNTEEQRETENFAIEDYFLDKAKKIENDDRAKTVTAQQVCTGMDEFWQRPEFVDYSIEYLSDGIYRIYYEWANNLIDDDQNELVLWLTKYQTELNL